MVNRILQKQFLLPIDVLAVDDEDKEVRSSPGCLLMPPLQNYKDCIISASSTNQERSKPFLSQKQKILTTIFNYSCMVMLLKIAIMSIKLLKFIISFQHMVIYHFILNLSYTFYLS